MRRPDVVKRVVFCDLVSNQEESAMRVAIVSDIHGNKTAFEAVLGDLKQTSPDIVYHGGDLRGNQGLFQPGNVDVRKSLNFRLDCVR
jgi:Icc-related predicted phosphoesterase